MKDFFSKRKNVCLVLVFIVVLGAFFRLYHVSDWLHFEIDQARDVKVIDLAVQEGIGSLPLLGPRAGGTFLRLGPGFYYLEYISALVFGDTPGGLVIIISLLSIASIVVFYAFVRRYFEVRVALALSLLVSVSAFLVLYGRFAWNPNPLPFFMMLGMYALLRAVERDGLYRERWFLVSVFSLGFATHLHFLAFVSLPIIAAAFLLVKRPRFSWKAWFVAIGIVCLLYLPVFLNETLTGGANAQEFLDAVQGKSNKENHTLVEQLVRNTTNHALGYWVMLTGYEESMVGEFESRGAFDFELTCDNDCHNHIISASAAMGVFILGILSLLYFWKIETDTLKKDFLLLLILWFVVCFGLFTSLSYDFSPRFFLLTAPFPFVFLGLIFIFAKQYASRYHVSVTYALWLLLIIPIISNISFTSHRLDELCRSSLDNFETLPDRILKEKTRVTLEQQHKVLDYMESFQKKNGYPIYMFSEPEYRRALKYLMERQGMTNDVLGFSSGIYTQGNYFLVFRTGSNHTKKLNDKYTSVYNEIGRKEIGTLTVIQLYPKPEMITGERQVFEPKEKSSSSASGVPERYTWSEWWNQKSGTVDSEDFPGEEVDN